MPSNIAMPGAFPGTVYPSVPSVPTPAGMPPIGPAGISTAEEYYKNLFLGFTESVNTATGPVYEYLSKKKDLAPANEWGTTFTYGSGGGMGAGTEYGPIPTFSGRPFKRGSHHIALYRKTVEITSVAYNAAMNSEIDPSGVDRMAKELQASAEDAGKMLAKAFQNDESGVYAEIDTAAALTAADTTITLAADSNMWYFEPGMVLDIVTFTKDNWGFPIETSGTVVASKLQIKSVNRQNLTITFATQIGAAVAQDAVAGLTMQASFGLEMTGLKEIFAKPTTADGYRPLYGIDRNDYDFLLPVAYDKSAETIFRFEWLNDLTMDLDLTVGSKGNFIVADPQGYSMIEKALTANGVFLRTPDNGDDTLKFGYSGLVYKGLSIVYDKYLPANTILMLSLDDFSLDEGFSGGWSSVIDQNGNALRLRDGYNIFESRSEYLGNIECKLPNKQGIIYDFPLAIA